MRTYSKVRLSPSIFTPIGKGILFLSILTLFGCDVSNIPESLDDAKTQVVKPEVQILEMRPQPVVMKKELAGRTSPFLIAEVRPQVSGIITKRRFKEGSLIRKGETLYQIEPSTYQAYVANAKAALARSKANLTMTSLKEKRYKGLLVSNAISQQEYDEADGVYRQAVATVDVDKASLKMAQINLGYTRVSSPISGRIGRSIVTPGALVTANQEQALAVVQQLDPIYVDLSQSSASILRMRKALNLSPSPSDLGLDVQLTLEDDEAYTHIGKLQFSEVTVDETMGSVILRAVFPNPEQLLMPGMFVRATVQIESIGDALLIPAQALTRDVKGQPLVMLLAKGNRVEARVLGNVELVDGKWLVRDGLNIGDKVIITGLQRIRPGLEVQVMSEDIHADITPELQKQEVK